MHGERQGCALVNFDDLGFALIREDALEVGKRVLAYGNSGLWKDAVVRAVSADGQSIDVQVGGWKKIGDRPRTKALVVSYAGAGALVRVASEAGCGALVEALLAALGSVTALALMSLLLPR
jgi:hypothetical protein